MKKALALLLTTAILAATLTACGESNDKSSAATAEATTGESTNQSSAQEQTATISSGWLDTYQSTNGDKEIVLTVTDTGGIVDIDGAPIKLTARAEYANEIQLIDGDGNVIHLTRFSDNSIDKRYDFAVTAKDDPATQIIGSTFMQRGSDVTASAPPANSSSQSDNVADGDAQGSGAGTFPYIYITYRAQEYDGILIFQKPNEEGLPTEIVIDGKTYALEDFNIVYIAEQGKWTGGGTGINPDGDIGFSVSGNNEKWMLWISGAFDMTSAYFGDGTQSDDDTGSSTKSYSFLGIVYKHENLDLTFTLQTPDANGYPTEIVINGVTYDETVTFDNETYALENVSVSEAFGSTEVSADWNAKERGFALLIQSDGDSWKMVGPGICSGYYYPEQ
jgi:hypothetical protein